MERYKQITTIKTVNKDTNEETTTEKTKNYIIKTWNELTDEEKEKEIEKSSEHIYQWYQDELYEQFKADIEEIKSKYTNIQFEDVYLDSNSQGGWIDRIKNFHYYNDIDIFGENIDVCDIDLYIRKYIEEITENNINIYNYYIDDEKLKKIQNTKKYKKWINSIIEEINSWIDEINDACKNLLINEYRYPYNIHDEEDAEYLNNYFCDIEFEYEESEEK